MDSISSVIETSAVKGTVKEMQLRQLLHFLRQAADEGYGEVCIHEYKLSELHMPTLKEEVLKLAGFKTSEFKDESGQEVLRISWQ